MTNIRKALASVGIGRLIYQVWHRPVGYAKKLRREGVLTNWEIERGWRRMEASVAELPTLPQPRAASPDAVKVSFLTGNKYWYQLAYCFQSLLLAAPNFPLRLRVVDDGSLKPQQTQELRRLFPSMILVSRSEAEASVLRLLPRDQFPALHDRRLHYPHIKKLIDVRAGIGGWQVVLDSDMLFFKKPDGFLDWLSNPKTPLCLEDLVSAYGYTDELLEETVGKKIPEKVNVGVTGFNNDHIDWSALEKWTATLMERAGSSYLLEQGLCAMLMAGKEPVILPRDVYTTLPTRAEGLRPSVVLHHYVQTSKREYFSRGWRIIFERSRTAVSSG